MGLDIDKTSFEAEDYHGFRVRLEQNLSALKHLLEQPGFGQGKGSIGAELEIYIIDQHGRPLLVNQELKDDAGDEQLTLELNRYNLEYNLSPYALDDHPFINTEKEICRKLEYLESLAEKYDGRIAIVGILPTLRQDDFGPQSMSDRPRYHALVNQLIKQRGSSFKIHINGEDPLQLDMSDVTLEGANTSFQMHYRVEPDVFADTYNAFQLMTPLAMAISANSPGLFGHMLWHETRVPLFKQSIDIRKVDRYQSHTPPRVNFGNGWLRRGAFELFNESVRTYDPLLPVCDDEDPLEVLKNNGIPNLRELCLHQGSVWLWNRPVYDASDGGHLRIEMRSLPAGPTAIDMVAGAALLIGLAEGVRDSINNLLPALPFYLAEYNFYRAAQYGLDAKLVWPTEQQSGCQEKTIREILHSLLPVAVEGLLKIGIGKEEVDRYMGVIENRLVNGQTGAVWQQRCLAHLEKTLTRKQSLRVMLELMVVNGRSNQPVSEWDIGD
ncbi:MAG: glutamate--cysteine ligase [Gammaproteobacteria bacterium]|jgi:gamma-glutamyl:cysteine ligase YbdK (ATP-grasp superfamily)|nr:glutamate--cysteine ligase [Gammaproteobacteria bacterium]